MTFYSAEHEPATQHLSNVQIPRGRALWELGACSQYRPLQCRQLHRIQPGREIARQRARPRHNCPVHSLPLPGQPQQPPPKPEAAIAHLDAAAVDARTDENFVIMARTDSLAVDGLNAAIDRACAYVEAGADMIFPEAITELPMYTQFAKAVKVPVLANITEFGATPLYTTEELAGVDVSLVLYPLSAFRAMNKAAENVYTAIRRDGTQKNVVDTMQTRMELYERINYHDFEQKLDALFAQQKNK